MISATHHVITVSTDVVVCQEIEWREGIHRALPSPSKTPSSCVIEGKNENNRMTLNSRMFDLVG